MCSFWKKKEGGDSSLCHLHWNFYSGLARVLSRFPFLVLFATFLLSFLATWLGISWHGLPVFEDPYLGFETRGTSIANRLVALENLREEFKRLEIIENYPGERQASRESRKRRRSDGSSYLDFCTKVPLEDYSRVALEIEDGLDVLSFQVIGRLCRFQYLVEQSEEYRFLCEKDGHRNCCPSWSLPNYVARHVGKANCVELKEEDVERFKHDLICCLESSRNESGDAPNTGLGFCQFDWRAKGAPDYCSRGSAINSTLHHALQKSYSHTNVSKFAMVTFPIPKNPQMPPLLEELMYFVDGIELPDDMIRLGGYDFGTKDELFKELLISDLQYVVVASVIIFAIVCCYTKSVLVTAISFGALTLSLGVSYFLYKSAFCITYFPFMNMLVTIIVLGIGTDGTLILSVAWRRCRAHLKDEPFDKALKYKVMEATLEETTATLFITTCTTAAAFFASLTSSITTIRCFSIFAGTSIIVSFFLLYVTVPTGLLASDILCHHLQSLFPMEDKSTWISKILKLRTKFHAMKTSLMQQVCRFRVTDVIQAFTTTKLASISFAVFAAVLVWGILAVFHSPGFELPDNEQFQLLSYNHPIEKYDRVIEPLFNIGPEEGKDYDNLTFYYVWGIKNVDNGNSLNPNDEGSLEFDPNFNLTAAESQLWIHEFCRKLKNQTFYDIEGNTANMAKYDACMLDTVIEWMDRSCVHPVHGFPGFEPCCNVSKFPYEPDVFSKCIGLAARYVYRTPVTFFRPDIAGVKFFTTYNSAVNHTEDFDAEDSLLSRRRMKPVYSKMGDLAAYIVRARTTYAYSISYEKMSEIYHRASEFFDDAMKTAPESLQGGFFISAHFNFYDLQRSLLTDTWFSLLLSTSMCFVFILIASHRFLVSLGAVAVILATVIVSSAILIMGFSWKLGVFESIAVTVAVGLSDFTTHHAIEFAKRRSITMMTSPTFFSALTTIIMGLAMVLFSQVLVYQQIGSFFFVLVLTSWLYSVFFLSPLLILLDAISTTFWYAISSISCTPSLLSCARRSSHVSSSNNMRPYECQSQCPDSCDCPTEECSCNRSALLPTISGSEVEQNTMTMERWKLLKKVAHETPV